MIPLDPSSFLFCLVLKAQVSVDFPFSFRYTNRLLAKHTKSYVGSSVFCSKDAAKTFYAPHRSKEVNFLYEGTPISEDQQNQILIDALKEDESHTIDLTPLSSMYLEQRKPYGVHVFRSVDKPLFVYGVYNSSVEMLIVTDLENYDELLRAYFPYDYFVYRFNPRTQTNLTLNTRRLCARWHRWSTTTLPDPAQRFCVLETSLTQNVHPS